MMRMTHIQRIVSEHYGITGKQLCSPMREKITISLPRQICMYFCREYTDASLMQVALFFGKKDHTTVAYAVKRITDKMNDHEFQIEMRQLGDLIRGTHIILEPIGKMHGKF